MCVWLNAIQKCILSAALSAVLYIIIVVRYIAVNRRGEKGDETPPVAPRPSSATSGVQLVALNNSYASNHSAPHEGDENAAESKKAENETAKSQGKAVCARHAWCN